MSTPNSPIRKTKHSTPNSNTLDESNFIPGASVEEIKLLLAKPSNFRCYDDIITLRSFLSQIPFFIQSDISGLLPKQVNDLCHSLELESFNLNDTIFNQGDIGDKLYIVLSGSVDIIYKSTMEVPGSGPRTREKILLTCFENSNFGERALESDEPRGASAICTEHTDLITINKVIYTSILKEFSFDVKKAQIRQGSKEYVIKMLSKSRTKRTSTEIETCATYLHKQISFFHKFNIDQMQELVRVADVVSIFSRQLLFKQGSVGQAFFVVLGGTVDVYVNSSRDQVSMTDEKTFGNKVNTVEEGNSFGERALENDNSLRMGSVFTCDGTTDLFCISKVDYQNLVQVMLNGDSMEKISLLRKTYLFCNVDVKHLRILSKFMENRTYRIDDELITVDEPSDNMIIISAGECKIEKVLSAITTAEDVGITSNSSIYASTNRKVNSGSGDKHQKHKVSLGRLGACSVLAEYVTQTDKLDSEIYHNNTVIATTIVSSFTLNKLDFFYHVPFETREYLIKLIRESTGPLLPHLWDNKIKVMDDYEWKKSEAWKLFREDLKHINTEKNILKNFK
jgi:CRP-like cAMP-binding protein